MRAWRRSPFTNRFLLARCVVLLVPLLLGWASRPIEARLRAFVAARIDHELERCLGRPVQVAGYELTGSELRLRELRTPRRSGEERDPLRVERLSLTLDWSTLLRTQRVRVVAARLDGARLRLPASSSAARPGPVRSGVPELLDGLLRSDLHRIELRDGSVEASVRDRPLSVSGLDLELRSRAGELHGELARADVNVGDTTGKLRARAVVSAGGVRFDRLELELPRGRLHARGRLAFGKDERRLSADGRLELNRAKLDAARELGLRARGARVDFELSGPAFEPARWRGRGRFALTALELRSPRLAAPLAFDTVRGELVRDEQRLVLHDVAASGQGTTLSGRLSIAGERLEAAAHVGSKRLVRLRQLLPRLPLWNYLTLAPGARGNLELRLVAGLGQPGQLRAEGGLELFHGTLHAPDTPLEDWPLARAAARFQARQDRSGLRVELTGLELLGEQGRARGSAAFGPGTQRLKLGADGLDPALLGSLLPGRFRGGKLGGTVVVAGHGPHRPPAVSGSARITNSVWHPPADVPFHESELGVRRASASFDVQGDRFEVAALDVEADLLRARGMVSGRRGRVRARAELRSEDAGRVLDAWPNLRGIARGGRGRAGLSMIFQEDGLRGTLQGEVNGGHLLLPSAAGPEHSEHPLARSRFRYRFAPRHAALTRLGLRGPEVNLDLVATWNAREELRGSGHAWLTRAYASELAGPWKLPLMALGRFPPDTAFRLHGDARQVRLNADIAHGARWRLLRLPLPRRLQAIARGETPVWRAESAAER